MRFFKRSRDKDAPISKHFWFVGLHLSSSARKLECALLGVDTLRSNSSIVLQKSVSFDIPEEIAATYHAIRREIELEHDKINQASSPESQLGATNVRVRAPKQTTSSSSLTRTLLLRNMIASIQEEALNELLADGEVPRNQVVAVVVNDPGLWMKSFDSERQYSYLPLTDAGLLAERTGLNVLDALYAKEWTPTGRGNPFLLLPYWILLGSGTSDKVVVDLGERARWHFLPSSDKDQDSWRRAFTCEASPCGALLNLFARESSKGKVCVDVGGKLSVQGRKSQDLLTYWQKFASDIASSKSTHYSPLLPVPSEDDFVEALDRFDSKVSSLDALCTAVHWIADSLATSLHENADRIGNSFDFIITGATKQNGLLFSRVSQLLPPSTPQSLNDFGFPEDSFDAIAVAVLGMLFASKIPAASPTLTSTPRERVLGRVTPGSPEAWNRIIEALNSSR